MNRLAVLFALALAACAPSKPAPDVAPSDAGAPDATVSVEPEHRVGSAIVCPIPGSCISGVIPQASLPPCDGGETYVGADGGMVCKVPAGGGTNPCDSGWPVVYGGTTICVPVPIPLTTIAQDDASAGQLMGWNGNWKPVGVPPVAIDAGTTGQLPEARLVACSQYAAVVGGASANQCGTINLASTVAVGTSKLPEISGGTGADLSSCTAGDPILAASGTFQCVSTLPVASGGTGAAPTCSSSQLVQAASSTALTCNSMSGDCMINSSGVITCPSANASGTGALSFGASTGTITAASTANAPGLAQASTTSTPGTNTVLSSQASTNAAGTPGNIYFNIPNLAGSGVDGYVCQNRGGITSAANLVCLGPATSGSGNGALFLGGAPSGSTLAVYGNGSSSLFLNAPSGGLMASVRGGATFNWVTGPGYFEIGTGANESAYGGANVLILDNGTAPSSACTGSTCVGSSSAAGFYVLPSGSSNVAFDVGPLVSGVGVSQFTTATQPSGSATGGPLVSGYQGQLYAWGEQSSSLPITETLLAPAYTGTLNTTAMTGGGTTAQTVIRLTERHVCSSTSGTTGTCGITLNAVPDSISETVIATITCTTMTANTGDAVGAAFSQTSTAVASLAHSAGTVTIVGTPITSAIIGTSGLTASAAWTASGTSPVVTWTIGSANLEGVNKCTINTDEQLN